jgi:hypothetical protein
MYDIQSPEYPFVGIPADSKIAYDIRWHVIRENTCLEYEQILRLLASDVFVIRLLYSQLRMHPVLQSEVFQSFIELKGGLPAYWGGQLIHHLARETRGGHTRLFWDEKPLLLLPPREELRNLDDGLFRRSLTLFQYICAGEKVYEEHWGRTGKDRLPKGGLNTGPAAATV